MRFWAWFYLFVKIFLVMINLIISLSFMAKFACTKFFYNSQVRCPKPCVILCPNFLYPPLFYPLIFLHNEALLITYFFYFVRNILLLVITDLMFQRLYLMLNLQISYQEYDWFFDILGKYPLLSYNRHIDLFYWLDNFSCSLLYSPE